MKRLLIILLFTVSNSFAQKSFIIDKKGVKTIIRDEHIEVLPIDKRISYLNVGKSWEKYIKFEDLDHAIIGNSLLKSFHLNQNKRADVYFVYGETKDKKLIGMATTVTSHHGTMTSSVTFYELYVIDNNENIIDKIITKSGQSQEKIENRGQIATMIRKYFSDCHDLMTKLKKYDIADKKNETILTFFSDTEYINCK